MSAYSTRTGTSGHGSAYEPVAVRPDGGAISAADYALGFVDLIEEGDLHREQVNLSH